MRKLLAIIFFIYYLPITGNCTTYTWDATNANIYIVGQGTGKTFLNDLVAGDIVNIPVKSGGGGYSTFSIYKVRGAASYNSIQINWQTGAYMERNFGASLNGNLMDSCVGVTIRNMNMSGNRDLWMRLGKNPFGPQASDVNGYSSYIRVVSGTFNNMVGLGLDLWSAFPNFDGTEAKTFHHWWIDSCRFDTSFQDSGGDQSFAITMGRIRADYWVKDLIISNSYFNRYWSITGPCVFIKLNNVWGANIYGNTFSNLGMATNPAGHAFSVGWDIGGAINVYNNVFGPNNWGDDVRGKNGGAQVLGDNYNKVGIFYNNISKDKRKYAIIDFRHPDGVDSTTLAPYYSGRRYGNEAWFNTVYNIAVGGNNEANVICLWYELDTVVAKGNVLVQVRDATWASANPGIVGLGIAGPISVVDTSNNILDSTWTTVGIQDSTGSTAFTPTKGGKLYNTGPTPPSYITTDIYGNPRSNGGNTDIGAVEFTIEPYILRIRKGGRIIVTN